MSALLVPSFPVSEFLCSFRLLWLCSFLKKFTSVSCSKEVTDHSGRLNWCLMPGAYGTQYKFVWLYDIVCRVVLVLAYSAFNVTAFAGGTQNMLQSSCFWLVCGFMCRRFSFICLAFAILRIDCIVCQYIGFPFLDIHFSGHCSFVEWNDGIQYFSRQWLSW